MKNKILRKWANSYRQLKAKNKPPVERRKEYN
jgi:hypothetical protein